MVSTWNDERATGSSPDDRSGEGDTDLARGSFELIDGVECYRIDAIDALEPFLMMVVSDADLWMFVSSTGSLTAGRVDADRAIFPYATDDQLHRSSGQVGPVTMLARTIDGVRQLWRPFHGEASTDVHRSLAKSVLGDRLVFEETNTQWQTHLRVTWAPSRTHGWVRTVELRNDAEAVDVELLDGVLDVMPANIEAGLEQTRSNLVNAFKRSEAVADAGRLAVYNLESLITDRAEPGEALTATAVWSWGFPEATLDLDERSVRRFVRGELRDDGVHLVTGRPGAYLLRGAVTLEAGASRTWSMVLDTGLDHSGLSQLAATARALDAPELVRVDVEAGSERLRTLLASADAVQHTGDPVADAHHLSNVMFNCMRGGVFPYEHRVPTADFVRFVERRNRPASERHRDWLEGLDPWVDVADLRAASEERDDGDLVRLVLEYLPMTFSRRHGDPSRPWNRFSIHVTDDDGSEVLRYEGNWRDIFQNWEALLHSFPAYFAHVVAKFVNASTLDGYNPYRISDDGVDWEAPDPHDPWANIGYWGDHQIIYLLRLLEGWERFAPGAISGWLNRPVFVYADVPYRITDRSQMIADPRNTITFLEDRAKAVTLREEQLGADGRLVVDVDGELLRVGLAEKLLVPALSKMSNYIPGGGIWMNTQRPEWNDANNALAGPGVSMVTVFHLYRYLVTVRDHLDGVDSVRLSAPVASWLSELADVYRVRDIDIADPVRRREMIESLGAVADRHGRRMLAGARSELVDVAVAEIVSFVDAALEELAASIRGAERPDGLVDSYNLVSFPTDESAEIHGLGPMLEGQVAALSCGVLGPSESLDLIEALFRSSMYRSDLDTFTLYPVAELCPFTERNIVAPELVPEAATEKMPNVFVRDADGNVRFRSGATNAVALQAVLDDEGADAAAQAATLAAYEATFRHDAFTGRSGSMHSYEGIGSVYWHMVSKLLLAIQEVHVSASDSDASAEVVERLARSYRQVRAGLGFTKTPEVFGAFPTDCYSHSPAHSGAQQPGMTGQVKEEVLTRLGELGVRVVDGRVGVVPALLPVEELMSVDDGQPAARFSFCAVPMTITVGDQVSATVVRVDGSTTSSDGSWLSVEDSAAIFARVGEIAEVRWSIAAN